MLVFDMHDIGERLLAMRKRKGITQSEAAEKAGLSDRTYADIERGTVNMRLDTLLKICRTFNVTPDELLTKENALFSYEEEDILNKLNNCTAKQRKTALELLSVYFKSLD
ncbi:MAG: helix-turn-helix transcriptional regulator [Clostridia bacterium]|nr:helix-turn-helix transcriptional regulator [Clostridia bacterium]